MKKLLEGSLVLTASNLIVRLASYIYRIIMGKMLTTYEFGILNLALPLQYLVVVLASSGIAPAIAKFVSERKAKRRALELVVSSSLAYYTIMGIVLGIAFYLLSYPIGVYFFGETSVVSPLQISAVALPFGLMVAVYTGVFQGLFKMDYMALVLLLQQVARIVFAVFLTFISATATSAILGSTIGFVVAVPVAYFLFKKLNQEFGNYNFGVFKEVFYFSIPISATAISSFVLAYIDILLLGYFFSPIEVGVYSAASPTSRIILAFSSALYAALLPSISELQVKNDVNGVKEHIAYSYKISLAVLIPATILSVVFSDQIISLLFKPEYIDASKPFQILVVGTAFLGIFTANSGIFQGLGKPKIPMKILAITAFLDIVLNILLIPQWEIIGAAIASTISFTFAGLASIIVLERYGREITSIA